MAWLCVLSVLNCVTLLAQSAAPRLVVQKIDETRLTTLPGHIHPAANAANDRGEVDDNAPVGHIVLLLKRTADQQQELDAVVDQLHNAKSSNYRKWLTPDEFGRRFGPADEDVAAVASWLESKGFTIEDIPPSKTHITFTGTVGQMRQTFHTDIHHLSVNGEAHQATMNEPQIPVALAPVVSGFRQLHDFGPRPLNRLAGVFKRDTKTGKLTPVEGTKAAPRADFTNAYNGRDFYEVGPQDFYTIYNENPLLTAGITGAGVTIAVIEQTQINSADPVSFRSQFGLPAYPSTPNSTAGGINYIYGTSSGVGGDAACTAPLTVAEGESSGDEGEADIDVEWAGTTAPNAIVDYVACGTTSNAIGSFGTDLAAEHIANYLSSTVTSASLSYGECEAISGSSSFYTGLWEQYAAQGQTAVVSAGDGGSMGCETLTKNTSVNIMADTAYNISAGGTDLGDVYISNGYTTSPATTWWSATNGTGFTSALSYVPETTWGGYCSNALFVSYLQSNGVTAYGSTYTPEAICNNSTANSDGYRTDVGGGGGVSTSTTIPTWQSVYGVGLYSSSKTHRNQPDISLFAANGLWGHALPYCQSDAYSCSYSTASDAYELEAGGTSFVAPQVAGLMALANQATGARQGQANYTLYNLAAQEYGTTSTPNSTNLANCSGSAMGASVGSSCIFQDIAADTPSLQGGTIASQTIEPCTYSSVTDCYRSSSSDTYGLSAVTTASHSSTLAYYAGAGYDLATGLGSVNVYNLIENWNTASPGFASTTTLSASASTVSYSTTGNLTLTATVKATGRGGAVAPAGVVEFFDGGSTSGTLLGTGSIASNCTGTGSATSCDGLATLTLASSTLTPGSNSIVAYFEGDAANDAASTSKATAVTVNNWPQTVTITSANTAVYGPTLTLTATASSGLTTFTYSVISGPATVRSGVLTFTGVGTVVVQASQAGNSTYAAAAAQQSIMVSPGSPTLSVATSVTPSTYGGSVTFTATISSGPSGTVTFYDGGTSIGTATISGTTAKYATTTLTAGTHTISAGWAGNADYNSVSSGSITQTVNQATPTITWAKPTAITYGTALSATQLDATANTAGAFVYSPVSGTVLTAGSQTLSVTFTPTDTTDYKTAGATVTLTVNQAKPAITWAKPAAITYGTALSATQLDATANTAGAFVYSPVSGTVLTAGSQTLSVTFTPTDTTDYTTATATVTQKVNQAKPAITWAAPAAITYGTALSATQLDATANTAGAFVYSPASGTVLTAGSKTLSVTFTPTDTTDYTTATTTVTQTVSKAPLTVVVNSASGTYGSALPAFTGSVSGLVNGDTYPGTVTLSLSTTAKSSSPYSDAGSYPITATMGGSAAGNYTVTSNTPGTLTITPAPLMIAVSNTTETYGSPLPTFTSTLTGLVNGDTSTDVKGIVHRAAMKAHANEVGGSADDLTIDYATTANSSSPYSDAGSYTITAALDGAGASNYTVTSNTPGTLTITPAPLQIVVNNTTGTYGSAPTFSSTLTGLVNGDTSTDVKGIVRRPALKVHANEVGGSANDLTIDYAGVNTSAPYSDAGSYTITATLDGAAASNYTVTSNTPGTMTITPAPLTIAVANATETYGNPLPTFSSTLTGLVNGDTSTDVKGIVHRPAVKHHADEVGGSANDLTIDYATTANSSSPYSPAGTYPITATLDGAGAGNYAVTSNTPGTLTVSPAPLTVVANSATGTYGNALPTFTGSVSGLVNGDTYPGTVTLSLSTTASSSSPYSDAGAYPITASMGGSAAGNYTVTSNTPGTLTIAPAPLTIAVANATETYGSSLPTFTSTLTGLVNGDTSTDVKGIVHRAAVKHHANEVGGSANDLTIDYATTANSSSPYSDAGSYSITATLDGAAAGNYTVTSNTPGTLTITPAPLQIVVNNATGTYGSAPAFSSTLTGLVNGDTSADVKGIVRRPALKVHANEVGGSADDLTIDYAGVNTSAPYSDVGSYTITATLDGAAASNYTVTSNTPGTMTITPAPLTIAVANATETYGNPLPTFASTLTGLVNGDTSTDVKGIVHRAAVKRHADEVGGSANDLTIDYATTANSSSPYSPAGTYPITATLDGTGAGNYSVTSNTPGTLTILATQTVIFTPPSTMVYGVAAFSLASYASASSGMPVSFQVISGPATMNGSVVTITGAGSVVIQASQAGNSVYAAASPVSGGFTVNSSLTPASGSTFTGTTATFSWNGGAGPTAYELWLGTTGVGSSNLYNSGPTTATSAIVTGLPTNGVTVYARLWSMIGGAWRGVDYTYTEAGTPAPASLTNPVPGNQLAGSSANFSWTAGAGPVAYELWLGTTGVGSSNLYNSGSLTTTSASVTGLPTNGVKIYTRLWSEISGKWQCIDYTYTEAGTPVPASLTSPAPGSVLTGSSATFSWTAGAGPIAYELWLGTTGVGSSNLYNSGSLTTTSASVTGLPSNGVTVYARLWSMISGVWQCTDYIYTEAGTPSQGSLTSPSPGSVLPGSNVTFSWTAGAGPTQYELWLSVNGVGLSELYNSGPLTTTSTSVTGLPANGVKVYARLWSYISGIWQCTDYTYTEAGTPVPASLTSPTQGSVLTGSSATFSWTAGAGPTQYELWLGTTGLGSSNLYNSGSMTTTSVGVTGLPTNGVTIYVRLWWMMSGVWQSADYTITEAGTPALASLASPAPGSQLAGSSVTFSWTPGAGPTQYELWLGTTGVGSSNLFNSGSTTATSATVTGLPTNGVTVYVRLWSLISGAWRSADYTYIAQ